MSAAGRRAVLPLCLLYAVASLATPGAASAAAGDPAELPAARVGDPSAKAAAPSDAVREAQRLMAEIGLWDDAVDGILDGAFRRALDDARRRFALPPASLGEPVDDRLLQALRNQAEVRRTQRKLDAAMDAEIARAEAAIAADPILRDHLRRRPGDAAADADRDVAACAADPTVACLLAEARETAKTVAETELRNWGLSDIAVAAVADAGDLAAAWPVLRLMTDPRMVFTALREIAAAEAAAGRPATARAAAQAARGLPDAAARAYAEAAAALAARADGARHGEAVTDMTEAATALLPLVEAPASRRATLVALARAAAARGKAERARTHLDQAESTADDDPEALGSVAAVRGDLEGPESVAPMLERVASPAARRAVLVALAAASAAAGDGRAAAATAEAIPEPRYRAVALAEAGAELSDPALVTRAQREAAAITLPFARAYAKARVAEAWTALGQPERALKTADAIEDDRLKVETLRHVAASADLPAHLAAAARAEAARTQGGMIDRVARLRLLAAEARAAAKTGAAAAGAVAREAVDTALATRDPWNRLRGLVAAADAVAAVRAAGLPMPPPAGDR